MPAGYVQSLTRYPVKSMQGEPLDAVSLDANGLTGDRRLALIDTQTNKVVSAKQPQHYRALLDCSARTVDGRLRIELPDMSVLDPDQALAPLSELLGRPLHWQPAQPGALGSYASTWPRLAGLTMSGDHDLNMAMATKAVSFVDMAAVHLMTRSTLTQLETFSPQSQFDPRRFRPNIMVDSDDGGFAEEQWIGRKLQVGECVLQVSMRTPRCVMTTVAQPGLANDIGVLRAAANNIHELGQGNRFACAGVYAEVIRPGVVRIGDALALLPDD